MRCNIDNRIIVGHLPDLSDDQAGVRINNSCFVAKYRYFAE